MKQTPITQQFSLKGRVALVTGGSKGLGQAMARAFAESGADVVIASRHEDELKASLEGILSGLSVKGAYVVADMTRREDIARLAQTAASRMGKIDILVNNAGSNVPQPLLGVRDADWDKIIELNLTSCMLLARAVADGMASRKWGRIINISSIMALASKVGRSAYSATKSALVGVTRAWALELGRSGVTVNCIAPGPFLTDLPGALLSDEEKRAFAERTALGRWGRPEELAGPALLLASDAGGYITGTVVVVDGGILCNSF